MSNGLTVSQFQEGMKKSVSSMTKKELQDREVMWRTLWSWTDDTVKRMLFRIGTTVRFMRRDYRGSIGELGEVKFEPSQIELATYEKVMDYNVGKFFLEKKVVTYPWAMMAWFEEIIESSLAEEEQPSLAPVPEEEEVEA